MHPVEKSRAHLFRSPIFSYFALVVIPIVAFGWILYSGKDIPPAVGAVASMKNVAPPTTILQLPLFLAQIAVIIAVSRLFGSAMRKIGQPQVVGEMIAGLALGPSLLGIVWPSAYQWLFPAGTIRYLNALSQIGLVLFMFLVGLELDLKHIRARVQQVFVISHAGMAFPILGGGILALFLYHDYAAEGNTFAQFTLFFACAMSVTAFPVLVRILAECKLTHTNLGAMATASASLADVTAWCMLAVIVALERGTGNFWTILWQTLAGIFVFLLIMFGLVRPALAFLWRRVPDKARPLGHGELSFILLVVLFSALATELLNIHAIFGAFVAGVLMPRDERLQKNIQSKFEDILVVLLLPLFFAFTGLRTNIGLLTTSRDWWFAIGIIFVAAAGKLGGSVIAARACGFGRQQANALGILMNSRGLMELVLLTIGLQDGVITAALFTMMVIMTAVTTMMTTPLLLRMNLAKAG